MGGFVNSDKIKHLKESSFLFKNKTRYHGSMWMSIELLS